MGFCTSCGNKLDDSHRFCGSCGSPVDPPTESETKSVSKTTMHEPPMVQNPPPKEITYIPDSVDRKTLFDDGMLVLTSKDLILYTSDEKDELKRIPISTIKSCGYSTIRRGLLIKRRINEDDNFQNLLGQKNSDLADLKAQKLDHEEDLRQTRVRIATNKSS